MAQPASREESLSFSLAELEQRYVEALARIREAEGVSDWKRLAQASWALSAVVFVASVVSIFLIVRPDAERRVAAARAELGAAEEDLRAARGTIRETETKQRELASRLDEETRRERELSVELRATRAMPTTRTRTPGPTSAPPAPPRPHAPQGPLGTTCPPGSLDPLCGLGK